MEYKQMHNPCSDCDPSDSCKNCQFGAYKATGLTPEDLMRAFDEDAVLKIASQFLHTTPARLRALAEADRDGRCVVLPCKVGDTVYEVAKGLSIYKSGIHSYVNEHVATELNVFEWARQGDLGKTVFLTHAEAEAALGVLNNE